MTLSPTIPHNLSLLEDEDELVEGVQRRMAVKGFSLKRVVPETPRLEDMVERIMSMSDGAFCDHHLRGGHQVEFSGAQVVAALTAHKFPAVLFTGLLSQERYAIRREMAHIPAFLNRDEGLGPTQLIAALGRSVSEVSTGRRSRERRGRRTPVTITGHRSNARERLVDALVSGWPGQDAIEIPADLLAGAWRDRPDQAVGLTFLATVNISQPDSDLVFFENFSAEPLETSMYVGDDGDQSSV